MKIKKVTWCPSFLQTGGFSGKVGNFYFDIYKLPFYPEVNRFEYKLVHDSHILHIGTLEDCKIAADNWIEKTVKKLIEEDIVNE